MKSRLTILLMFLVVFALVTQVVLAGLGTKTNGGVTSSAEKVWISMEGTASDPWWGHPRVSGNTWADKQVYWLCSRSYITTETSDGSDWLSEQSANEDYNTEGSVSDEVVGDYPVFVSGMFQGMAQDHLGGNWSGTVDF